MVAAVVQKPAVEEITGGNPTRPPLIPSERDNAVSSRRPKSKQISSRYLYSSHSSSNSSSSSSNSTISSSGSSSASSSRRYPSPMLTGRASTPGRRSHSAERHRPQSQAATPVYGDATSAAARALCTTTRSLSVSFQGESFFYQTSKTRSAGSSGSPARRRASTPTRTSEPENSRHHRWPAAAKPNLNRSIDCSVLERKEPVLAAMRLLQQHSMIFDDERTCRNSFDASELHSAASSDTESVSSGSNSGNHLEQNAPQNLRRSMPRGISVAARFWQETNNRLRRIPQTPATPLMSPVLRTPANSDVRRSLVDNPALSPKSASSPLRGGMVRPSSPNKLAMNSPSRGMVSPMRGRNGSTAVNASPGSQQPGNAPSIISFAAEVRRAKKGENRIEEAHLLRLFDNRHVQWRWINARTKAALSVHEQAAEDNLYNAWLRISELRDSVTIKTIKLHLLTQNLKLTSILKGQMAYLEEWSAMDRDHSSSLSGAIEALKASTLRLPVVGGARAELQEVKDAVCSAVDVMQAMGSSICSILTKVEATSSLVCELAKMAAQEQVLLDQSRDLLSSVAAMHVKQCSLRGHLLQLKRKPSELQL